MSAVSIQPQHGDDGLELWLDSYAPVIRWMTWQFSGADEQELHDSVVDAWGEICARGTHTAPTPQARSSWMALARLRQLDRVRKRRYRDEHGLGSVALSDELAEVTGREDTNLHSIEEQQAASASLREVVAYLDEHLSPVEQQYLHLRWHSKLGRQEIATELGISPAAVGRLVTSTAKCVRRFYALRESRELCDHARELIDTLVAQGQPGVLSHPQLRAHLGSCPRCQQLAVGVPRELRGAAPLVGSSSVLGTITSTVAAGVALTQGAGGVLAGLGAAKVAVAGALLVTAATGALVLSEPSPHPRARDADRGARVTTTAQVALPMSGSIGSVPDPAPSSASSSRTTKTTSQTTAKAAARRRTRSARRSSQARAPRAATAAETEVLTGMASSAPEPAAPAARTASASPSTSSGEVTSSHEASSSEAERAFGVGSP